MPLDKLAQIIPFRADNRQTRPEIIKQAGAKRQARFKAVEMRADAEIRLRKDVLPLVIRQPCVGEKDGALMHAECLAERNRLARGVGDIDAGRVAARPLRAEKEKFDVAAARADFRHCANHGAGIEPFPEAAAPQHNRISIGKQAARAAKDRLGRRGRLIRHAKGNAGEQAVKRRIGAVRPMIDAPRRRQQPHPIIALPLVAV